MVMIEISERPLAGLFGSESAYQVLMYLERVPNREDLRNVTKPDPESTV
jgi:hypothetical protein